MSVTQNRRGFATTRWSLVLAAADSQSAAAQPALATLCETYWLPVYAYIRRDGASSDDARDLTQAFFAQVLEKRYFAAARQERGRFRSFLLAAVRHFLANQRDHDRAAKRGGGQRLVPLEFEEGERQYLREPIEHETPEHVYERRWALVVLNAAMDRLAASYDEDGRGEQFRRLKPFLTGDDPPSYAELARELRSSEGALRMAVHRLRQQFAASLADAVAETVERREDVDRELRHLRVVVGR